jgi:hypothetical protein
MIAEFEAEKHYHPENFYPDVEEIEEAVNVREPEEEERIIVAMPEKVYEVQL